MERRPTPMGLGRSARRAALLLVPFALLASGPAQAGPFEEAMVIVTDATKLARQSAVAIERLREAIRQDPKNAHAHYNLGLLLQMAGDQTGAAGGYRGALRADADYLPAEARLTGLDLHTARHAEAVTRLERIIEESRFQAEARNLLAGVAIEAGDWDTAVKHARNVLLGDPDNENAYLNLALAYYQRGLVDQAWLIASNALDRKPAAAALHNIMGLIYLKKDDSRHATESFLQALKFDPQLVDARLNLGALELAYGDFDSALERFERVLEVRPDDPMVVISRAVALRGLKRYPEAEAGYDKALALRPGMLEAEYNLCVLHYQYTSEYRKARAYCRRYANRIDRSDPKYKEVKRRLKNIDSIIETLATQPPAPEATEPDEAPPASEPAGAGEGSGAAPPAGEPAEDDDEGDAEPPAGEDGKTTSGDGAPDAEG